MPLALARARTPREDVENELRAVDDLPTDAGLDLAQLGGRQLVVEDDGVDVRLFAGGREEVEFAATEERRGIGTWTLLRHAEHDLPASGMSQAGELIKGLLGRMPPLGAGNQPDERDALVSCVRRGT